MWFSEVGASFIPTLCRTYKVNEIIGWALLKTEVIICEEKASTAISLFAEGNYSAHFVISTIRKVAKQ